MTQPPPRRRSLQDVPGAVPRQIFHEAVRLNYIGMAASNAKEEFVLTDGKLGTLSFLRLDRWVRG